MKAICFCLALAAMTLPGVSQAYTRTVICDGCGDTEYMQTALRHADGADAILVFDGANAQLRKYRVSSYGDREMNLYRHTVKRVTPTTEERARFDAAAAVYANISYHLESCGAGAVGDWLVPDLGWDIACEEHDICYANGGSSSDRAACDQQLYDSMRAFGADSATATIYYLAVRAAGWMYFNYQDSSLTGSGNGNGCAYLEVCDLTVEAILPR